MCAALQSGMHSHTDLPGIRQKLRSSVSCIEYFRSRSIILHTCARVRARKRGGWRWRGRGKERERKRARARERLKMYQNRNILSNCSSHLHPPSTFLILPLRRQQITYSTQPDRRMPPRLVAVRSLPTSFNVRRPHCPPSHSSLTPPPPPPPPLLLYTAPSPPPPPPPPQPSKPLVASPSLPTSCRHRRQRSSARSYFERRM